MSESGEASCSFPGSSGLNSGSSRGGPSFPAGRGLPATVRSLASPPPPVRLTSLRTRDLTLGGGAFKKPKKTFEPNVHAIRKSKNELNEKINVAPKKERKRDERRGARENRGRRRERPPTIQSHSIFEQGPADVICKTGWRGARDLHDYTTSTAYKPAKKERKHLEEDEDEILSKLQRDDFIDDPNLTNDAKLRPIQVPLCESSSFVKKQTLSSTTGPDDHRGRGSRSKAEPPKSEQPSLANLLHELSLSDREELFFMQLPDCIPGRVADQKPATPFKSAAADKVGKKEVKSEDKRPVHHLQATGVMMKDRCTVLSQMPEGFLGKLQIRKSGKVALKMGDIVMDVSEGAAFSFLQELVSVRSSEAKTGDMMVLGNVHHKLVLSPDFQSLLNQTETQQKKEP